MKVTLDLRACGVGVGLGAIVFVGIAIGSHRGSSFDAELTFYAIGSVLAAIAVGYRFSVWSQRPPTKRYLIRGLGILMQGKARPRRTTLRAAAAVGNKFVAQKFIRKRSWFRWIMHLCLSGGCSLAFAITFPLVFGWVHFEPSIDDSTIYIVQVFGVAVDQFPIDGVRAFLLFNSLNISGVIVLVGCLMALFRRLTDAGEKATQRFLEDIVPLLLILAVAVTGLALTVSYKLLQGDGHSVLAIVHLISVLALLFYIPFGKLFHMFQRICSLCVVWYKQEGEAGVQAICKRCSVPFASLMHVEDLKEVLDQLGFNYRYGVSGEKGHYQDICPACRRRLVALNQGQAIGR